MNIIKSSNLIPYTQAMEQMQKWLDNKEPTVWFLEHEDVFTVGRAGVEQCQVKQNLGDNEISVPTIKTDRGGGIVYHGPGQRIVYFVCPMNYIAENISKAVERIEDWLIKSARDLKPNATFMKRVHGPGIWMQSCSSLVQKISFIGLRVSKVDGEDWLSHGIAINYNANLGQFEQIAICNNDENVAGNLKVSAIELDEVLLQNLESIKNY